MVDLPFNGLTATGFFPVDFLAVGLFAAFSVSFLVAGFLVAFLIAVVAGVFLAATLRVVEEVLFLLSTGFLTSFTCDVVTIFLPDAVVPVTVFFGATD